MHTTMLPAKFSLEPIDLVAYDRWMDREALVHCTPAVRAAWALFRPTWRAARAADLAPVAYPAVRVLVDIPPDLVDAGVAFGCATVRRTLGPLTDQERATWFAYRARVLRADPDAWGVLWSVVAGSPLPLVADRYGWTVRHVRNVLALMVRWWLEMQASATQQAETPEKYGFLLEECLSVQHELCSRGV